MAKQIRQQSGLSRGGLFGQNGDRKKLRTERYTKHLSSRTRATKFFLKYGESRFRIVRKIISSYYEFLQFVFVTGNKRNYILKEADEFLKNNKRVDCIIATGDPFVLFKYASKLSRKYSVPWIADYRDAWIQDNGINNPVFKKLLRRFLKKDFWKMSAESHDRFALY